MLRNDELCQEVVGARSVSPIDGSPEVPESPDQVLGPIYVLGVGSMSARVMCSKVPGFPGTDNQACLIRARFMFPRCRGCSRAWVSWPEPPVS